MAILRAGIPPTTVYGGTSFVTTEPAATTAPSPILIPCKMTEFGPIQALLPTFMPPTFSEDARNYGSF